MARIGAGLFAFSQAVARLARPRNLQPCGPRCDPRRGDESPPITPDRRSRPPACPAAVITLAQLVLIVFLIITGLTKARIENATPFLPFGGR